jgi:hypothetical protein
MRGGVAAGVGVSGGILTCEGEDGFATVAAFVMGVVGLEDGGVEVWTSGMMAISGVRCAND